MRARYIFLVVTLIGALTFSVPRAQAGAWGEPTEANIMLFTMQRIERQIEGALLSALKIAAIEVMNSQVGQLVTGGGGTQGPLFITNYNDFLYRTPAQRTNLFMNDFFTLTTRGKAYGSNYIGVGSNDNLAGNYGAYLESVGRQAILENTAINVINLDEYAPNPELMFANGDWRAFNAFFSNPANNPYGYALQTQQFYQQRLAMEQEQARILAGSAGGFLPNQRNGTVLTPAASIQSIVTDVSTLANRVVTGATNPAELAGGIILAVGNRMMKNLIQRGLGEMQAKLHNEIGKVDNAISGFTREARQRQGEATVFLNDTAQRTHAVVNATTPPPPAYYGPAGP